ncbi:hypothetical protein FS837_008418, partial [Tulasnella sp. UAMH 9824]
MEELAQKLSERLRVAPKRGALNAHASIHHLPNEILVRILRISMDRKDVGQAWQRSKLASVCRRWLVLVDGSPELWTTITSRDDLTSVSRSLVKSGNSKLDILGDWCNFNPIMDQQRLLAFLELVIGHCERWRSLDLQLPVRQIGYRHVLYTPNLEYLSLVDVSGESIVAALPPFPIPLAGMARLRYLHLDRVSIRWDGITTPLLSTLILKNIYTLAPPLSQLFDFLSNCPRLATLCISNVGPNGISPTDSVNIPHLRDVTLISMPRSVVECIMHVLYGPPYPSENREGLPLDRSGHPSADNVSFTTAKRVVLGVSHILIKKNVNSIRLILNGRYKLELGMVDMRAVQDMLLWFHSATTSCDEKMPPVRLEWDDENYISEINDLRPIATSSCITYLKLSMYN